MQEHHSEEFNPGPMSARCFTTDDGEYACTFQETDSQDGSFKISAPGKPTYALMFDHEGKAFGFIEYGDEKGIALPGQYIHEGCGDCWVNDATGAKICVHIESK